MSVDVARLRRLADAATDEVYGSTQFRRAATPSTVIALLDEIEKLRIDAELSAAAHNDVLASCRRHLDIAVSARDEARSSLHMSSMDHDELREALDAMTAQRDRFRTALKDLAKRYNAGTWTAMHFALKQEDDK